MGIGGLSTAGGRGPGSCPFRSPSCNPGCGLVSPVSTSSCYPHSTGGTVLLGSPGWPETCHPLPHILGCCLSCQTKLVHHTGAPGSGSAGGDSCSRGPWSPRVQCCFCCRCCGIKINPEREKELLSQGCCSSRIWQILSVEYPIVSHHAGHDSF